MNQLSTIPKISLYDYQESAISRLRTGSILCGRVGSGKSLTALAYYQRKESSRNLYIVTTAAKRDSGEWEKDCEKLDIVPTKVDSWNNIAKYTKVNGAFFIFDEQRVVGSGKWVRSFLKIAKTNAWILLSATPGDSWKDYIPVFIANGFYKNRTEFSEEHIVWNSFTKFPKIDRYIETGKLLRYRHEILVNMAYEKKTESIVKDYVLPYDKEKYDIVLKKRWNPFANKPIREIAELCQLLRKIVNSDKSRLARIDALLALHRKAIIFYNYNYELDILRRWVKPEGMVIAEYNGQKHEPIPVSDSWIYLVQYSAGAEGWNCIETNTVIFYSLHYSYRMMTQAAGRIDRLNTGFSKLYYYRLTSESSIDMAILKALRDKKDFNESRFINFDGSQSKHSL